MFTLVFTAGDVAHDFFLVIAHEDDRPKHAEKHCDDCYIPQADRRCSQIVTAQVLSGAEYRQRSENVQSGRNVEFCPIFNGTLGWQEKCNQPGVDNSSQD